MMQIFVKPTSSPVKDKHGHHISMDGAFVPHDAYWAMRLHHGDVVQAQPPPEAESPANLPDIEPSASDVAAVLPPRKRKGA